MSNFYTRHGKRKREEARMRGRKELMKLKVVVLLPHSRGIKGRRNGKRQEERPGDQQQQHRQHMMHLMMIVESEGPCRKTD